MSKNRSAKNKRDTDIEIPGRENLRVLIGSRAHGTHSEDSDRDERNVFQTPTSEFFKVGNRVKHAVWREDKSSDLTGWELGHFVKLAAQCNPTILEVLWAPFVYIDPVGEQLREKRHAFLDRKRIVDAFRGYSHNQRKKMLSEPNTGWTPRNWKFAEAYIRVLYQGAELLKTGELPIDLTGTPIIELLLRVKRGMTTAGEIIDLARRLDERLLSVSESSDLGDQDPGAINKIVLEARKGFWE